MGALTGEARARTILPWCQTQIHHRDLPHALDKDNSSRRFDYHTKPMRAILTVAFQPHALLNHLGERHQRLTHRAPQNIFISFVVMR